MIFSCEKQVLAEAVSTVIKAATNRSSLPVLEGILINTDEDRLILTTNNLELGIECRIPAVIREDGAIVISDAKVFSEIVRKLPSGYIDVEVKDNYVTTVKSGKSVYNIMGLNPEEFPELPVVKEETAFTMTSMQLKAMIRQTMYAISQKNEKQVLMGALFEVEEGNLCIVALDGFRMAIRTEQLQGDWEEYCFIVPGRTLAELTRILQDDETPVSVKVTNRHVLFMYNETRIISRLIDGEYFNYKSIIPSDFKIKTRIKLADLLTCVERADPIVAVDVFKNPVVMTVEEDTISIDCMTATGKAHDVIEIENCNDSIKIGFNQRYLHDALSSCECDMITMEFNGNKNPCIIRPTEGNTFLYMVLPVRISEE